jgi:ribose 5-phosphate isomerase B
MRVHVGSDHAGFDVKQRLVQHLSDAGHDVVDHGPAQLDPDDDYPPYCLRAAEAVVAEGRQSLGVVIGGSGNGEQIAANKVHGVRCALAWNDETARLARLHNDANVVGIGARMHDLAEVLALVDTFLGTAFSDDERHARRIAMLSRYEETRELPPLSPGPQN